MNTMIRSTLSIAAAFLISVAVQAAELGAGALSIGEAQGDVTYRVANSETFVPAPAGTALPQGAVVKTGPDSTASVVFSSGSVAIITENSTVNVSKFLQAPFTGTMTAGAEPSVSETELIIEEGEVISVVAKLRKGSSYTVSSPVGAAGVRGTIFGYRYNSNGSRGEIVVLEGSIVLIFGDRQVEVGAGFTYNIRTGEVTPTGESKARHYERLLKRLGGSGERGRRGVFTPDGASAPVIPIPDLIGVSVN